MDYLERGGTGYRAALDKLVDYLGRLGVASYLRAGEGHTRLDPRPVIDDTSGTLESMGFASDVLNIPMSVRLRSSLTIDNS